MQCVCENESLPQLVDQASNRLVVKEISNIKNSKPECGVCPYTKICGCGCPAVGLSETREGIDNSQCKIIKLSIKNRLLGLKVQVS